MHFYTYDEWYNNYYYSQDSTEISRNDTRVIDLSTYSNPWLYLHIRSVWSNPKFTPVGVSDPVVNIQYEPIDCDLGCLYQLKENTEEINDSDTPHLQNKGYIQSIDNHWGVRNDVGTGIPDFGSSPPYMGLRYITDPVTGVETPLIQTKPLSQENFELLTLILRNDTTNFYSQFERILIYQCIYSGAISFQDMYSRLEFNVVELEDFDKYPYESSTAKIITSLEKNDTWMLAAAMLTFDTIQNHPCLLIENVSQFVYGHVDMDQKFNWNLLWKNYHPKGDYMPSSIMHFAKTKG